MKKAIALEEKQSVNRTNVIALLQKMVNEKAIALEEKQSVNGRNAIAQTESLEKRSHLVH